MRPTTAGHRLRRATVASLVVLLGAAGCGLPALGGSGHQPAGSRADYDAKLWPQRPVVQLGFTVSPDLATVAGREAVRFTPDAQTCELVFRAWPNNPSMAATGSSLTVTSASVEGSPVTPDVQQAGAPTGAPGTLIELKLPRCVQAGQTVRADLRFTVELGRGADERVGFDPESQTAWFGSAFPLLSWVRGQGWTRDPAVQAYGETATSEDFTLEALDVAAPTGLVVTGSGTSLGETAGREPGTTVHRFRADAVRDVTVGVGRYELTEAEMSGVAVHLALPTAGTNAGRSDWQKLLSNSIGKLTAAYGPFPYADLWITITPGQSDGSEFPGAVQFGDGKRKSLAALVAHELAHQYFYALVGNNQARDPWLDESFAAYSEAVVLGDNAAYTLDDVSSDVQGKLGQPMAFWARKGGEDAYDQGVYQQGAAVLTGLRAELGDEFDADLRDYIADNAHRVAAPADLARAFQDRSIVLDRLRRAGALSAGG